MEDVSHESNAKSSIWLRYFSKFILLGILGYLIQFMRYLILLCFPNIFSVYVTPDYELINLLNVITSRIASFFVTLGMTSYIVGNRGRLYWIFSLSYVVSLIWSGFYYTGVDYPMIPEFFLILDSTFTILVVFALWTSGPRSASPLYTRFIAVYIGFIEIFGYLVVVLVTITGVYFDTLFPYMFLYILYMIMLYLEIKGPNYARLWNDQLYIESP